MVDDGNKGGAGSTRRGFLGWAALVTGLGACAATGAGMIVRYLLPPGWGTRQQRLYVGQLSELPVGSSRPFSTPSGQRYLLTNLGDDVVVAFNDTCPHLGCKVHWEQANDRFFCPCHGGAFDKQGAPIAGPPKDENTPLKQLALEVDGGALYALVPIT